MKVLKINDNGPGAKGLAELNQYVDDEKKKVRDGVAGEGQGLSEESRIIEESGNENGVREELGHPQVMVLRPQQQVQGQVVRWERFLPVRSLKVLLVESDDSTRHVVSALLRNCSYEVTAVPNGLQAWKILEDLNHQIDLVLTELVMPGLSGFDLLSRITSHQTCQNIPVIMMSSHDSIGIVLKCLSKGAADFLVKPIRKNELKNLWQHVWRKWHSSSGSGSESGIQTQKSIKSKSLEESDNDTGSNDEDDTKSLGSRVRDGSDNGSGTQSSWTKKAVEADSSPPLSPWDQLAEPPDSTCAQVIHSRDEAFASSWVLVPAEEHKGQDNRLDNVSMGKDLEIGLPGHLQSQPEDPNKSMGTKGSVPGKDQSALSDLKKDGQKFDKGESVFGIENDELRRLTVSSDDPQRGSIGSETPENSCYVPKVEDKMIENADELPSLELTLKRMGEVGDVRTNTLDQNVLRHSELSAFTRYNTGATVNHGQAGNVGSCSPLGNSSEPAKKSISDATLPNQNSNSSSNNNDMGSTTNNSFRKPPLVIDKGTSVNYSHPSAFQSVQNSGVSSPHLVISGKASTVLDQQKHNYFYDHHDGDQLQRLQSHDDLSIKKMAEEVSQCGSSNMGRTVIKANAANYGLNGSASGSNHGSNANYGSSAAAKAEGTNVEHDNGIALRDVADDGTGSSIGGRAVVDQNRSAQREAALNKFRQKRKERCFEKRVRYQSRKKLAEQRPRIRGQFVRQVRENKDKDADS